MALDMEAIDVKQPSTEYDQVFNAGFLSEIRSNLNRTSVFVHIVEYQLICGNIMQALYSPKKPGNTDVAMRRLRDGLLSKLVEWQHKTSDLNLSEPGTLSPSSENRSSFLSKDWFEMPYHNPMLMFFRPSPMLSDISGYSNTLQKLFSSSKGAVLLYASLHRTRKINYSCITLHSVFMAGLTYLYAYLDALESADVPLQPGLFKPIQVQSRLLTIRELAQVS